VGSSREPTGDLRDLQAATTRHEIEIERLRREVARLSLELDQYRRLAKAPAVPAPMPAPATRPAPATIEASDLEPPAPTTAPSAPTGSEATPPAPPDLPEAAQAVYDQGYSLYHQNRYLEAETAFQRFLQAWGESELADNALFWIGASRLARGEADTALAAFREVTSRYPEGNKVPDALLKIAEISERAGDLEGATTAYRQILTFHPDSAAASIARDRRDR
jgi:tol-pal system protein YbgF